MKEKQQLQTLSRLPGTPPPRSYSILTGQESILYAGLRQTRLLPYGQIGDKIQSYCIIPLCLTDEGQRMKRWRERWRRRQGGWRVWGGGTSRTAGQSRSRVAVSDPFLLSYPRSPPQLPLNSPPLLAPAPLPVPLPALLLLYHQVLIEQCCCCYCCFLVKEKLSNSPGNLGQSSQRSGPRTNHGINKKKKLKKKHYVKIQSNLFRKKYPCRICIDFFSLFIKQ